MTSHIGWGGEQNTRWAPKGGRFGKGPTSIGERNEGQCPTLVESPKGRIWAVTFMLPYENDISKQNTSQDKTCFK